MTSTIDAWLTWLGLGGLGVGALLAAAWFFGMMPILGAIAALVASVLAPILGAFSQGIVWVWQNALWPLLWRLLKDLFDDWVTLLTGAALLFMVWQGVQALHRQQLHDKQQIINACYRDLRKATSKRPPPRVNEPSLGWPFSGW